MTQPAERRFVMEPRLDAEVETLNTAISNEATARTNADALKVAKAGDTMTGALVLPGDPTLALQAAPKQYVDSKVSTEATARIDGDALKVAKAGDTMTGALVLSGDPTLALHAATKQYVDAADAAIQASITTASETSRIYVKNGTTALTKGTPVYITGADGTNVIVGAAGNGSEATSSKTIGLLQQDLAINAMGYAVIEGKLTNIDTSGAGAAGDAVWLGPNGTKLYGLANKPVAPAHMVYLGVVAKKNASTGEISVHIQNGFELDELHNVLINNGTLATGQALTYDASTSLWKNATPVSALAGLSDVQISGPVSGEKLVYNGTKWVNLASAGGSITVASTAPDLATSSEGDAWLNDNDGTLFVCLIDADGTKLWMQVQANSALEGSILARLSQLESSAIAYGNPNPNMVINGGMDIWQRGTSAVNGDSPKYFADRWHVVRDSNAAGSTYSRQAGPDGSMQYCIRAQRDSGSSTTYQLYLRQALETADSMRMAGKTVTLSFYARKGSNFSAALDALSVKLYTGTGVDQAAASMTSWTSVATPINSTATLTALWTRFTFTGVVSSAATQVGILFTHNVVGTAGANDYYEITGVQLEVGNTATAFRRNSPNIQAELAACQRYFEKSYDQTIAPGTSTTAGLYTFYGSSDGSSNSVAVVKFAVTKRTSSYTITSYISGGTSGQMGWQRNGAGSTGTSTLYRPTDSQFHLYTGVGAAFVPTTVDFQWTCNAEL